MKAEIAKEIRYAFRNGRVVILAGSFLFLALLTPVMLKIVLPQILSSQLGSEDHQGLNQLIGMSQLDCMRGYLGDVFEIGTLVVAFTLCSLLASEIRDNTLVFSLCSGKRFESIVLSKLLVFGILLAGVSIVSLFVDYAYAGILFGFEIGIFPVFFAGLLQGIYMQFLLVNLLMWGAFLRKPIPAGIATLATAYGLHFISLLLRIESWTPSGLLVKAQELAPGASTPQYSAIIVTVLAVVAMVFLTLAQLRKVEWNKRTT